MYVTATLSNESDKAMKKKNKKALVKKTAPLKNILKVLETERLWRELEKNWDDMHSPMNVTIQ